MMRLLTRFPVPIRLLWTATPAMLLIAFFVPARLFPAGDVTRGVFLLFFCVLWSYLTARLLSFHRRLTNFLRRLLAGDYDSGIRDIPWIDDEISRLTALANKAGARLHTYDVLRSERTGLSYRIMDTLFRRVSDCVAFANMEKQTIRFNEPARALFDATQETVTFDALEKVKENTRFFRFFMQTVLKTGVVSEETHQLRFPAKDIAREVRVTCIPFKDSSEKVTAAFLFLRLVERVE